MTDTRCRKMEHRFPRRTEEAAAEVSQGQMEAVPAAVQLIGIITRAGTVEGLVQGWDTQCTRHLGQPILHQRLFLQILQLRLKLL